MKANVIFNVIADQFIMDQSRDNSVLYNSLYAESPSIRTTTSKHVGRFFKKCNFQFHYCCYYDFDLNKNFNFNFNNFIFQRFLIHFSKHQHQFRHRICQFIKHQVQVSFLHQRFFRLTKNLMKKKRKIKLMHFHVH